MHNGFYYETKREKKKGKSRELEKKQWKGNWDDAYICYDELPKKKKKKRERACSEWWEVSSKSQKIPHSQKEEEKKINSPSSYSKSHPTTPTQQTAHQAQQHNYNNSQRAIQYVAAH